MDKIHKYVGIDNAFVILQFIGDSDVFQELIRDAGVHYYAENEFCMRNWMHFGRIFDTDVAIKSSVRGEGETIRKEYQMLKNLRHSGIVEVLALIKPPNNTGSVYLIMKRVSNCYNLHVYRTRILSRETFTLQQSYYMFKQLVEILILLHSKRIIHHDLWPKNVLVQCEETDYKLIAKGTRLPRLILCDFEIAEELDADGHACEEERESGMYNYTAPEQKEKRFPITEKIDIYSLGRIGIDIFLHNREYKYASEVTEIGDHPSKEDIENTLNRVFVVLLYSCTSKKPEDRPSAPKILELLLQIEKAMKVLETIKAK
jgi:serine/threonine protein kinase